MGIKFVCTEWVYIFNIYMLSLSGRIVCMRYLDKLLCFMVLGFAISGVNEEPK